MKHVKTGLSHARKVTALLLVLVMVLALPVVARATNDVPGDTVRVYPWRNGAEGLEDIAYEFSGVAGMRIIHDLEEIRGWPGFREWSYVDRSGEWPVYTDYWLYESFESFLGGQMTVIYVDAPATVTINMDLPADFPMYVELSYGDETWTEDLSWRVSPSFQGRLDDGTWWDGSFWSDDWDFMFAWDEYEHAGYITFDRPGVFLLDKFLQPYIYFVVRYAEDETAEEPEPEPQPEPTPPTAPNLTSASTWAHDGINTAYSHGFIPQALQSNYTQATTRAEFAALAVQLYETVTGREITQRTEFNDTTDVNVQKMGGLGIVTGIGGGYFAPDRTITRQEAAALLARLAYAIGQPLPASAPTFADNAGISSWAVNRVGQVQAAGIMTGVGNNNFAPNGTYTREQSIVSMPRLFELLD